MRWRNRRTSSNIEDRRNQTSRRGKAAKGSVGTIVIALAAMYFFGVDPQLVMNILGGGAIQTTSQVDPNYRPSAAEQQLAQFTGVVLADTEDVWHPLFKQMGKRYQEPRLVLFTDAVRSACGHAQASMGPFYCPGDNKIYIDLGFYQQLKNRHDAPGDFAQAYVIAHEVGHHVQNLLGISGQVQQAKQRMSKEKGNQLSVMLELQADCFSGVWAHHTERAKHVLEQGDIEEALTAASAIGDDRLQKQARGYASPESFTHGTSEQRVRWFKTGFSKGTVESCNTFEATRL
ncbi:MAG: flagellar biosynthesis protein FlgM [Methylophaga sp.]|nr:MAG: flagellar biosynthesis protein FlgM [Methylophaga sp.]